MIKFMSNGHRGTLFKQEENNRATNPYESLIVNMMLQEKKVVYFIYFFVTFTAFLYYFVI